VEVLSLVRGGMFGDQDRVQLAIPRLSTGLRESATVFGTGLVSGLNWALDGGAIRRPDDMGPVDRGPSRLTRPQNIGLMATARRQSGMGAPVFVAVEMRDPSRGRRTRRRHEAQPLSSACRLLASPMARGAEWRVEARRVARW
jgi:hypothetical protein